MNKFKQLCKGYDIIDHEGFCIVTNEDGAFISVADLAVVVSTNIWVEWHIVVEVEMNIWMFYEFL